MEQVCKFFASGQCRFGRECRFVHPGSETSGFGNNTFGNPRQAGFGTGGAQAKLSEGFNLPTEESIRTDLTERPTWFLSSYAPGKDPPAQLIDGKDISPEEARVMAYKLRAEGNPAAYEAEWNRLTGQANTQIRNILSDLPGAVGFMKHAYETIPNSRYKSNNTTPSTFGTTPSQPSQPSPFANPEQSASAFAQPQTPAFGQPSLPVSAFNQQPQPNSVFGAASPFNARPTPGFGQSAFGQPPAAPAFGQPAFGAVLPSQPQSAFGQSALGQSTLAKPAFGQPAFGQPPVLGQSTSPFGNPNPAPTSAFGQPSPFAAANVPKPAFGQSAFGQSPFAQSLPFATNTTTPHAQPHIASAFGQPQQHLPAASATFGQSSAPNVFQQAAAQNASSPFSNTNPFQQSQQAASNPFQQTTQAQPPQPVSAFAQASASVSAFGTAQQQQVSPFNNQNPFQGTQQQQQQQQQHQYQHQQSAGYQTNPQLRELQKTKKWDDPVIEYIQAETDAFAASAFILGNVPTVAPSREMCWG